MPLARGAARISPECSAEIVGTKQIVRHAVHHFCRDVCTVLPIKFIDHEITHFVEAWSDICVGAQIIFLIAELPSTKEICPIGHGPRRNTTSSKSCPPRFAPYGIAFKIPCGERQSKESKAQLLQERCSELSDKPIELDDMLQFMNCQLIEPVA